MITKKKSLFFFLFFPLFFPLDLFAVQHHGGAEGLVSHQIGHLLFILGMIYMLYRIYKNKSNSPGWFEFKGFIWLLIFWNILTFSGHWMREFVEADKFQRLNGRVISFWGNTIFDFLFYISRLDHLVLIPSFMFLVVALKKWRQSI